MTTTKKTVLLITQKDCVHCEEFKSLLQDKSITYKEYDLRDTSSEVHTYRLLISRNKIKTTPVLITKRGDWVVDVIEVTKFRFTDLINLINS